jgi:hypothetical protein
MQAGCPASEDGAAPPAAGQAGCPASEDGSAARRGRSGVAPTPARHPAARWAPTPLDWARASSTAAIRPLVSRPRRATPAGEQPPLSAGAAFDGSVHAGCPTSKDGTAARPGASARPLRRRCRLHRRTGTRRGCGPPRHGAGARGHSHPGRARGCGPDAGVRPPAKCRHGLGVRPAGAAPTAPVRLAWPRPAVGVPGVGTGPAASVAPACPCQPQRCGREASLAGSATIVCPLDCSTHVCKNSAITDENR